MANLAYEELKKRAQAYLAKLKTPYLILLVAGIAGATYCWNHPKALPRAIHYTARLTRVAWSDLFHHGALPLTAKDRAELQEHIDDYQDQLRRVWAARAGNGYVNSWTAGQIGLALADDALFHDADYLAFLKKDEDGKTGTWVEFGNPDRCGPVDQSRIFHVSATSWVLLALARTGNFDPSRALHTLVEVQNVDGAWPLYGIAEKPENSSTYATAIALLALGQWRRSGKLDPATIAKVDDAIRHGVNWLHDHRASAGPQWRDYPENVTEGSLSIAVSSLAFHVLDTVDPAYRRELDVGTLGAQLLDDLPQRQFSPWDREAPGVVLVPSDNDVARSLHDGTRYYLLPWLLIAIRDSYKSGSLVDQVDALAYVEREIGSLDEYARTLQARERPWIVAELLIAMKYIVDETSF